MRNPSLLVTGASGFVGSGLCQQLSVLDYRTHRAGRSNTTTPGPSDHPIDDLTDERIWATALRGIDVVIHLAARTHVLSDHGTAALEAYRAINVQGTKALARQAAASGVQRLIFLSSIKVNGEATPDTPFTEIDTPAPEDAYGISKWEAEQALMDICASSKMEFVIVRPPLVYGPGVKGNFLRLLDAVARGVPLPLNWIDNQRSMIYLGNLVDAVVACIKTPAAAGKTFLVSDGEDVSTPLLIRKIAAAFSKPPRLWPCPVSLLHLAASLLGKRDAAQRVTGSLCVDSAYIRRTLGWQPPFTLDQGLALTAQWYDRRQK